VPQPEVPKQTEESHEYDFLKATDEYGGPAFKMTSGRSSGRNQLSQMANQSILNTVSSSKSAYFDFEKIQNLKSVLETRKTAASTKQSQGSSSNKRRSSGSHHQ